MALQDTDLLPVRRGTGNYHVLASEVKNYASSGVPDATETQKGVIELASTAETGAGTDTTRAVHPAGLKAQLQLKANLASPALTGTPTAPTAVSGTNNTQLATTAFVQQEVAAIPGVGPASEAQAGIVELATQAETATGTDNTRAIHPAGAKAVYAPLESPALTGTPTAPTAAGGTNTTQVATTAFVQAAVAGGVVLPNASETQSGIVELATAAETATGTDATRAVHPAGLKAQLDLKASLVSPSFSGSPSAPTASSGTNTSQLATTAFVQQEIATIPGSSPASEAQAGIVRLATSAETATGTDNTIAVHPAGLKGRLDLKANLASPSFTGTPTAPTASSGTNNTQLATTAFVQAAVAGGISLPDASETQKGIVELATSAETAAGTDSTRAVHPSGLKSQLDLKADLASPSFTGNPTAPTQSVGNNSTRLATTAFVTTAVGNATPNATETTRGLVELATAAETATGTDSSRAVHPAGLKAVLDALPSGSSVTFKNAIYNADFRLWSRGTSITVPGSGGHICDGWRVTKDGTVTTTASRETFSPSPNGSKYYMRVRRGISDAAQTFGRIEQRIEGVETFAGREVTLSVWACVGSGTLSVSTRFDQIFGTGGSPSTTVGTSTGTLNLTTTWQKFEVTVTLPDITGKTLGTNGNDYLTWRIDLPTTAFDIRVSQLQIEPGGAATEFERLPLSVDKMIAQRYLHGPTYPIAYIGTATGLANIYMVFPAHMRAVPSSTYTSGAGSLQGITATAEGANIVGTVSAAGGNNRFSLDDLYFSAEL